MLASTKNPIGMSPGEGAEESVSVRADPVAGVLSVPFPPTDELLQLATSTIHPPKAVIGSHPMTVDDPVVASVIVVTPAGALSKYHKVSVIFPLAVTDGPSVYVSPILSIGAFCARPSAL